MLVTSMSEACYGFAGQDQVTGHLNEWIVFESKFAACSSKRSAFVLLAGDIGYLDALEPSSLYSSPRADSIMRER